MTENELRNYLAHFKTPFGTAMKALSDADSIEYKLLHFIGLGIDNAATVKDTVRALDWSYEELHNNLYTLTKEGLPVCYFDGKLFASTKVRELECASGVFQNRAREYEYMSKQIDTFTGNNKWW